MSDAGFDLGSRIVDMINGHLEAERSSRTTMVDAVHAAIAALASVIVSVSDGTMEGALKGANVAAKQMIATVALQMAANQQEGH